MDLIAQHEETNMLTNQIGGERMRAGFILNKDWVLEIYEDKHDEIRVETTPLDEFIKYEFESCGESDILDSVIEKVSKSVNVIDGCIDIKIVYESEDLVIAILSNNYMVIAKRGDFYIV